MNSLHHDLARALQAEHLASARQRHLAHEVRRARRGARRAERAHHLGWPQRRRFRPDPFVARILTRLVERLARTRHRPRATLAVASDPSDTYPGSRPADVATLLELLLDVLAEQVMELGTRSEAPRLEALARAAGEVSPGAAAALVDWEGSEIARLRAFSIVQGVVLRDLGPFQQSSLLDRLNGSDELPLVG